jgi:hypothetical protein
MNANGEPKKEMDVCSNKVKLEALRAVLALNLDFGAVDVIYNQHRDRAYVLEVNTAPGIAEYTTNVYAEHLRYFSTLRLLKKERGGPKLEDLPIYGVPAMKKIRPIKLNQPIFEEDFE